MSNVYNDKYLLTRHASLIYRWYKEESVVHAREREREKGIGNVISNYLHCI